MTALTDHDPQHLRSVFAAFPSGVTALAAEIGATPVGLAASSFTSVSLDPPLVSVCVARTSATWPRLRTAVRLGVNVLGAHQQLSARRLAGPASERFTGLDWQVAEHGAIALDGVSAWFDCSISQEIPAGDHDIVVLRVHATEVDHAVAPLVFHGSRFRELAL